MNLKEYLDYRNKCVICQKKLMTIVDKHPNLFVTVYENSIRISSRPKNGICMFFNFDGSYRRGKRYYKIYGEPLKIIKYCKDCCQESDEELCIIKFKSRSIGYTTMYPYYSSIDNIKKLHCSYSIDLRALTSNHYSTSLKNEIIRYFDGYRFHHVMTDFSNELTVIHTAKFEQKLEDMLVLRLPATNLSKSTNTDQLIDKVKLLTLFS